MYIYTQNYFYYTYKYNFMFFSILQAVLSYFTAALPRGQNLHTVRHSVEGKTGDHHELEAGQSIDQIIYQARKDGQSNAGVNSK